MRNMIAPLVLIIMLGTVIGHPLQEKKEFSEYLEMRDYLVNLYQQKKFEEAADLLARHIDRFPDNRMANSYNLALVYLHLEKFSESLRVLKEAVDLGLWFGKYSFEDPLWDPMKKLDGYGALEDANNALVAEARKSVRPKLEVIRPVEFEDGRKYPLFIALHGGNSNIEEFKRIWSSETLKREFLVAYPQSSQLWSRDRFSWHEDIDLAKKEIQEAFDKITRDYPVDQGEIVIGGFSAGGEAALESVLAGTIPATGFVVLCPARPKSFNARNIRRAGDRGVRGVLLTTEFDKRSGEQKEMVEAMNAEGLPVDFVLTPDIGHWFPKDLDERIDRAVESLRKRRT